MKFYSFSIKIIGRSLFLCFVNSSSLINPFSASAL